MKPYIYVTTVENDRAMVYTEFIHGMREYTRDTFQCTSILMRNRTLDVKESIDVIMKRIEDAAGDAKTIGNKKTDLAGAKNSNQKRMNLNLGLAFDQKGRMKND